MHFCVAAKSLLRSTVSFHMKQSRYLSSSFPMTDLSRIYYSRLKDRVSRSARVRKYRGIPFECRWSITFPLPICKEYMQRDPQGPVCVHARIRTRVESDESGRGRVRRVRSEGLTPLAIALCRNSLQQMIPGCSSRLANKEPAPPPLISP